MSARIGVDVGGTFTDVVVVGAADGGAVVTKEPTTPSAPEEGVLRALDRAVPREVLAGSAYFLHGTTAGLNALLEGRGAKVGLLATRGFRDVLEVRRSSYGEVWNPLWRPPPPLVPRRLRLPVTERVMADGAVHTPLVEDDVAAALAVFRAEGVESVAIAFLHAYAAPDHELQAEALLSTLGFAGAVSVSHRVSGEYREFERTATTVLDAYLRPVLVAYLDRLEAGLRERGFAGELLVTRSGGGALTFGEARRRPFETIMSGPVAGVEGASRLARELGLPSAITADVGGTSFDTCLVTDGRPAVLFQGEILDLPVQAPWVDVRSIGAGGGSIARVDAGGLLRVGPHSAGAEPGPAAYGRGGSEPTVTDAALVLGLLGPAELAGGALRLDRELAVGAIAPHAERLGLELEEVARGVIVIAASSMAGAIKAITVERGEDPRRAALVAFGGAGPLFATLLARELGIHTVVIPPFPGNFSAWGLLGADIARSAARTRILPLDDGALTAAGRLLAELFRSIDGHPGPGAPSDAVREAALDLRFTGQEHTLSLPVRLDGDRIGAPASEVENAFHEAYARVFGLDLRDPVQLVTVRATVRTPLPEPVLPASAAAGPERAAAEVDAYSFTEGRMRRFALRARSTLAPGTSLTGPAILVEDTATTVVDAGFVALAHPSGALVLSDAR
jgi:N-methylhydantoinase A